MDRAMAGPLRIGPSGCARALPERADRERIRAAIRGSRLISRESSADPSRLRVPLIRPEQPPRRGNRKNTAPMAEKREKLIAFFVRIPIYYTIRYFPWEI
jgi:hypothetical protein